MVVGRQRVQVRQREAAPRCAQNRQPADAVAPMQQRARQRQQVLHRLALVEALHLHRREAQPGSMPPNFPHQRRKMLARARQHGDLPAGIGGPLGVDGGKHLARLGQIGIATFVHDDGMRRDAGVGRRVTRLVLGRRGLAVADRAARNVVRQREHPREG